MDIERPSRKAPEGVDRHGISLAEFSRRFPDHRAAEAWYEDKRWPRETVCPRYGSVHVARVKLHNR